MTVLQAYRDDGPLATWLGRRLGGGAAVVAPLLTIAGAAPMAIVLLVSSGHDVPWTILPAALWLAVVAGAGMRATARGGLAWTVPPLLRLTEYGLLIALASVAAPDAMPACFALLGALAFHHYDIVYRLRHQGVAPPAWVRLVGGGWDGRLGAAAALALAGALDVALVIGAAALGAMFVAESVASWQRFVRRARPSVYRDDDELEAA
jgi:Family of unknown function (DUF5941)